MGSAVEPGKDAGAYDVIVVGAGVVGASLAAALGRAGRRVLALERDLRKPDRIVGELLQPGGVRALQHLGLARALEDIDAVPVEGYRVFLGADESVDVPYPGVAELPSHYGRSEPLGAGFQYEGRSFHYGSFIMALRALAREQSSVTLAEATVQDLVHDASGRVVGVRTAPLPARPAQTFRAPVTVVADGCFSKFRKVYGGSCAPVARSHFVGLELPPDAAICKHHGHVILSKDSGSGGAVPIGPVIVYQIGSDATRILIDVPGAKLPSTSDGTLQAYLTTEVAPRLPGRLGEMVADVVSQGARLRSMPNNFLPPSVQGQRTHHGGLILVGDAMNMRHPMTGGGMTVGLWDVVYLTHILGVEHAWSPLSAPAAAALPIPRAARDLRNWAALAPVLKTWHWRRKRLAGVINVLAQALYCLYGLPDANLIVLRMGCYRYFECGGENIRGPISLLAGLAPDPLLLTFHFFAVALYAILLLFRNQLYTPASSKPLLPFIASSAIVFYVVAKLQYDGVRSPEFAKDPKNPYAEIEANWAAHIDKQMVAVPGTKEEGFTPIFQNAAFPQTLSRLPAYDLFTRGYSIDPNANCLGHRPWDEKNGCLANHFVWRSYADVETERTALGSATTCWAEQGLLKPRFGDVDEPGLSDFVMSYWGPNRPEVAVMALALSAYSRCVVSLYDNYDAAMSCYILQHSTTRVVMCTSSYVPAILRNADKLPALAVIVLLDTPGAAPLPQGELPREQVISDWAGMHGIKVFSYKDTIDYGMANMRPHIINADPKAIVSLCYTSGTTGAPKASLVTAENVGLGMSGFELIIPEKQLVVISYLPLAHIMERGWELYTLSMGGAIGYYSGNVERLQEDLQILRPTCLPAVPRVLNRVAGQIQTQMEAPGLKGALLRKAVESKVDNYNKTGSVKSTFWDALVFRKVRAMLGGNLEVVFTGSAPCHPDTMRLLRVAMCVDLREGYGQTENSAYATFMAPHDRRLGSVGPVVPSMELRLRDCPELNYLSTDQPNPRGEILFRGDSLFAGYLGDEAKTRESLLEGADGKGQWLLTGDVGEIDQWGRLRIIDRVKNLIKLAQGEYVAIERAESMLASHPLAQQLWLYGDSFQPYLVGMVIPEPEPFAGFVSQVLGRKIEHTDAAALEAAAGEKAVVDALLRQFVLLGKRQKLGSLEHMRALKIRMDPFTPDNGLMTPTLKVKRQEAAKQLRAELDALYAVEPINLNSVQDSKA
ncbi:long-chain-fatty-acid--CoA ligase [Malassezia sp. CBS 17886]|nr:long-chain-fatty-acid--CoA ligase [Malassezia sp. CBS 17886]